MKLSEHPLGIQWLRQFDAHDVHAARLLIDTLKLVSLEECEVAIGRLLEELCLNLAGPIAIFTIDKKLIDPSSPPGNEGRLAHLIRNIERLLRPNILIEPDEGQMRTSKIKHIVIIDDFIGSGQRMLDYWKEWGSKSIKSWLSSKRCHLSIAGYAAYDYGLKRIRRKIKTIDDDDFHFSIKLQRDRSYWPRAIREFCEKQGERTELRQWPLGYGDLMCPLVFQHGCPDNCATVLWSNGLDFQALFPNRGVHPSFAECFRLSNNSVRNAELLWRTGQFSLALSLIDKIAAGTPTPEYSSLITILGLLLRGVSPQNLSGLMTLQNSEVENLLVQGRELGLLSDRFEMTPFGRDLVKRSRKSFITSAQKEGANGPPSMYFPDQFQRKFCGVQRKSSNEPS